MIGRRQFLLDLAVFAPALSAQSPASLHGAGATFPAPIYRKWFDSFAERNPGAHIQYDPVGSEAGIQALATGKIDFAGSDIPLTDERLAQLHLEVYQFPLILGGVVPIYNLEGNVRDLNFTPEILAGIYAGKIRRWNDPKLKAVNRQVSLPDKEITAVHRSDGSGTTFVFTDFLSKISPEWKTKYGSSDVIAWPAGIPAPGNEGVADVVQKTPNCIGYVELIYAIQHKLSFGAVRNAAGKFIQADLESLTAAAAGTAPKMQSDFRISITNAPGRDAYPIATFTWLLVPKQIADPNKKAAMIAVLRWALGSGQRQCSALGYAPLPAEVMRREQQVIDGIK
jgi:phosphate transport system substrate-binding protein